MVISKVNVPSSDIVSEVDLQTVELDLYRPESET